MTQYYLAEIKAEMSALKDIEKSVKWLHITLRKAEELHIQKELSSDEMVGIAKVIRDDIAVHRAEEIACFQKIAKLYKAHYEATSNE